MKRIKTSLVLVVLLALFTIIICSCQEGNYGLFSIIMPKINVGEEESVLCYINMGILAGDSLTSPSVQMPDPNPYLDLISPKMAQAQIMETFIVYDVIVNDELQNNPPLIRTNLTISLGRDTEAAFRGKDLMDEFSIKKDGNSLTIAPRAPLPTPVLGRDDLEKTPRIKGKIATIVVNGELKSYGGNYVLESTKIRTLRFPVMIKANKDGMMEYWKEGGVPTNKVNLQIKAETDFCWMNIGNTFDNTVIEVPIEKMNPRVGFIALVQNARATSEVELLAPSENGTEILPEELADASLVFWNETEINIVMNGVSYTAENPFSISNKIAKKEQLKPIISVWGMIKK